MYRAERPASREPRGEGGGGPWEVEGVDGWGRAAGGGTGAHRGRTGHSLRLYRILVKCEIFYGHSSER